VKRVDIPGKVTGQVAYVQDLRLPDMVHARVVRPPSYGARLTELASDGAARVPGVLKIVRDGNFLAVIAEHEYQAVVAMRALAEAARWEERAALPAQAQLYDHLRGLPARDKLDLVLRAHRRCPRARSKRRIGVPTRCTPPSALRARSGS
jgi:hypothetical protein